MINLHSNYVLKISGKDSYKFIDSLISNKIENEKFKGSYLLKPDGKIDYWFLTTLKNEDILILQQKEELLKIKNSLEKYKIRIICELEIIKENYVLNVSNQNDKLIIEKLDKPFQEENWNEVCLKLALPTSEITLNGLMPNEVNMLDSLVDYYKGCFLGQEQTSRVKFRGKPRRILKTNDSNIQEIVKI